MVTVTKLKEFVSIISKNKTLLEILKHAEDIISCQRWYIVGGSIYQTVWNANAGNSPAANIRDYDIVYFDRHTYEEQQVYYESKILERMHHVSVEVTNEALITDEWYERKYGCPKDTTHYLSLEDSIAKMSVSLPVVGISLSDGKLQVLDLADLDKLLQLEVFPNFKFRDRRVLSFYIKKYKKWHKIWPQVKFYDWDGRLIHSLEEIQL
jgi:hypothetical protein